MEVFFRAEKRAGDPDGDPVLVPVFMTDDGDGIVINKELDSIWNAFMLTAGFSLAQWIDSEGGLAAVQEFVEKRDAKDKPEAEADEKTDGPQG